jgi:hypothetical protein
MGPCLEKCYQLSLWHHSHLELENGNQGAPSKPPDQGLPENAEDGHLGSKIVTAVYPLFFGVIWARLAAAL